MATPVPPKITDHSDKAIVRLTGFTLESPNLNKLIRSLTIGTQNIENVLDDLIKKQALSTAEGVQLDNLGTILDLERVPGQTDSSYSAALLGRAAALSEDSGTAEQLVQIYKLLLEATSINSGDLGNAAFEMIAIGVDDGDPIDADVRKAMDAAKAAGVRLLLNICVSPCFLWGNQADADANGDLSAVPTGWGNETDADANGDIAPGVGGGNFARVLT